LSAPQVRGELRSLAAFVACSRKFSTVFTQPNTSSIRFRNGWLILVGTAYNLNRMAKLLPEPT
jgi:hypothetical protein